MYLIAIELFFCTKGSNEMKHLLFNDSRLGYINCTVQFKVGFIFSFIFVASTESYVQIFEHIGISQKYFNTAYT